MLEGTLGLGEMLYNIILIVKKALLSSLFLTIIVIENKQRSVLHSPHSHQNSAVNLPLKPLIHK